MKTLLLFDCFGVVMREVAPYWFRRYYTAEEADRIKEEMMHDGDVGAVPDDALYRRLGETVGVPGETIRKAWEDLVIAGGGREKRPDDRRRAEEPRRRENRRDRRTPVPGSRRTETGA